MNRKTTSKGNIVSWVYIIGWILIVGMFSCSCSKTESVPEETNVQEDVEVQSPDSVVPQEPDLVVDSDIAQDTEKEVEPAAIPEPAFPTVSARALWRSYDTNKTSADREWKGKIVIVTGVIDDFGEDWAIEGDEIVTKDTDFVTLQTGVQFRPLQCIFSRSEGILTKVTKTAHVRIQGKVDGIGFADCLYIRDCTLIEE